MIGINIFQYRQGELGGPEFRWDFVLLMKIFYPQKGPIPKIWAEIVTHAG